MKIISHTNGKKILFFLKAQGFQISYFYWLFSSDVMTVKGLTAFLFLDREPVRRRELNSI